MGSTSCKSWRSGTQRILAGAWLRHIGWAALTLATLAAAFAPDMLSLPKPQNAIVLDRATFVADNGEVHAVTMPDAIYLRASGNSTSARYQFEFDLSAIPPDDLFAFVQSFNRHIVLALNGAAFYDSDAHTIWSGAFISNSALVRLPASRLVVGKNTLTMAADAGPFAVPAYFSPIYVGLSADLAPAFKTQFYLYNQLKIMALAAQVLLAFILLFMYFFRPNDPLFSWFAAFSVLNLFFVFGMMLGWQPSVQRFILFFAIATPAMAIVYIGVALALVEVRPPRSLRIAAIAATCALLPAAIMDTPMSRIVIGVAGGASTVIFLIVGTTLIAWAALRRRSTDARLILPAALLLTWYVTRDAYVTATLPANGFNLLSPYARPVFYTFITIVLARRMGTSLDQLDRANETLNVKLAEREAELAALHSREQAETTRRVRETTTHRVREHERQRLTHDLHDGISGHLASIIALSEKTGDKSTEQAAREALSDLRLVIYSLDLGDQELPVALANLRERLVPQLQRLGIELDWSIAGLPEVSGVTPGNALAVLRILQEAITNALKHGPARKIKIRGGAMDGMVAITLENDGHPFLEASGGNGLTNMRRRAQQLNGKLNIEALDHGTRLSLLLPARLPTLEEDEVVA